MDEITRKTRAAQHVQNIDGSYSSEQITQDNDWATAPPMGPPDSTENLLWKAYHRQLAVVQLAIHRERNTRMDTKLQRYFNSTPQKNSLARVLYLSAIDKQLVTIAEVSRLIHTSRQATLKMLNECVEEGWATKTCPITKRPCGNANRYQGTNPVVEAFELYGGMHFQAAINAGVVQAHAALRNYMEIADKQLSPLRQSG